MPSTSPFVPKPTLTPDCCFHHLSRNSSHVQQESQPTVLRRQPPMLPPSAVSSPHMPNLPTICRAMPDAMHQTSGRCCTQRYRGDTLLCFVLRSQPVTPPLMPGCQSHPCSCNSLPPHGSATGASHQPHCDDHNQNGHHAQRRHGQRGVLTHQRPLQMHFAIVGCRPLQAFPTCEHANQQGERTVCNRGVADATLWTQCPRAPSQTSTVVVLR